MTTDQQELIDVLAISLTNYDATTAELKEDARNVMAHLNCTGPELIALLRDTLYGIISLPQGVDMLGLACVDREAAESALAEFRADSLPVAVTA